MRRKQKSDKLFLTIMKYGTEIQIVLVLFAIILLNVLGFFADIKSMTWTNTLICLVAIDVAVIGFVVVHDKLIIDVENDFFFYTEGDILPYMENAKANIYIVAVTGVNMGKFGPTIRTCTDNNIKVNILLCTASKTVQMSKYSLTKEQIDASILDNTDKCSRINALLAQNGLENAKRKKLIEVKLIDSILTTSFIGIDLEHPTGKIQCEFYQYMKDSPECPVIMFDRQMEEEREHSGRPLMSLGEELNVNTKQRNWYKYYEEIILKMWNEESNFDFNEQIKLKRR